MVHAHPEARSFCTSMHRLARRCLQSAGHEVRVSDLYEMGFDPVAKATDFPTAQRADPAHLVYALEQRHAVQAGTLPPDIRGELDRLLWCDLLVLTFPLFWFSTPAILKGWIDRVLVSGTTYGGRRFYDRGGLAGRKAFVALTLGGQEHMFDAAGIHGRLEDMLKPLLQGTLAYTGLQVLPPFAAYHVPYVSAPERAGMLRAFEARLTGLEADRPLVFPSLDRFDAQMRPLASGPPAPGAGA